MGVVRVSNSPSLICSVAPVEAIVRLAQYVPVFPCRLHSEEVQTADGPRLRKAKSPLVEHGLDDATQNPEQIRAWWRRWPEALVGVRTGSASNLVVIDYDTHKVDDAAKEWVAAHTVELSGTLIHSTLNNGKHYLYRPPAGTLWRTGKDLMLGGIIRKGIDLRAEGGYIIWWPLHGGGVLNDTALPLPAGLIDERRIDPDAGKDLPPLPQASPEKWRQDAKRVAEALCFLNPEDYSDWTDTGFAIHLASGGSDEGFALWHAFSAGGITGDQPNNYSGIADCRYHWASFRHDKPRGKMITLGTLFHRARERGWKPVAKGPEAPPLDSYEEEALLAESKEEARREREAITSVESESAAIPAAKTPEPPPLGKLLIWTDLIGKDPPEREWIMPHWIPAAHVTLLSGRGGIGKSLLAQHLGTAIAAGVEYVENLAARRVLMWAAEDDMEELWRRQLNISMYLGAPLQNLENFRLRSCVGCDVTLAAPVFNALTRAPMLTELQQEAKDFKAELVILDNIARVFGGNENDRHQVTTFLAWLQAACEPAAVLLLGHPAKAAGSEFSGSSAWEGAVRARLYFSDRAPDQPEGEDQFIDPAVRYLARRKANYSELDMRKFNLREGTLVPESIRRRPGGKPSGDFCRDIVLRAVRKLADKSIFGTSSTASPTYLPRLAKQYGLLENASEGAFGAAMRQLVMDGALTTGKVGSYANRTPKMGLVIPAQIQSGNCTNDSTNAQN